MVTSRSAMTSSPSSATLVDDGRQPHQEEGEGGEQEGCAQYGADAYLAGRGPTRAHYDRAEYSHDRDHRLRQRRPHRSQDAPHRPVPQIQALAHDLDRVGEEHRRAEYRGQG